MIKDLRKNKTQEYIVEENDRECYKSDLPCNIVYLRTN